MIIPASLGPRSIIVSERSDNPGHIFILFFNLTYTAINAQYVSDSLSSENNYLFTQNHFAIEFECHHSHKNLYHSQDFENW